MDLGKFNYSRIGSGPPVLFVNGVYQRRQAWEPIANALASSFEVILFDFPNQSLDLNGGSADPSFDRPEQYEGYVLELLEALSLDPGDVMACGLSFGSGLLRSLHLRRNVDFKKLVLMGAYPPELTGFNKLFNKVFKQTLETHGLDCYASMICFWFFSHKWLGDNPMAHALIVSRYRTMFADGESIHALFRATAAEQERGVPGGKMRCDTVFVNGIEDAVSPPQQMESYAKSVGAGFRSIAGGHVFTGENPALAAALLRDIFTQRASMHHYEATK
ncbi:alpha/beta fold hydrolase [uncultured Bradyrhizobium sp.]|uniref:alpha/beta fold hydrolase n=1 Tax=uncultured Bradyrhizobium sp. TaxID=199684 RepID=UPI0035CACD4F